MKATQVKALKDSTPKFVCIVCGTETHGYYGVWGDTGTCSRKCERIQSITVAELRHQIHNALREKEKTNASCS